MILHPLSLTSENKITTLGGYPQSPLSFTIKLPSPHSCFGLPPKHPQLLPNLASPLRLADDYPAKQNTQYPIPPSHQSSITTVTMGKKAVHFGAGNIGEFN